MPESGRIYVVGSRLQEQSQGAQTARVNG